MAFADIIDFVRRITKVIVTSMLLGLLILVLFYYYIYKKSPPKPADIKNTRTEESLVQGLDLMLDIPVAYENITTPSTTVAGRTLYVKNRVLIVAGNGQYASLVPSENGAFSVEMPVDSGPNMVAAYVFPEGYFARTKQKLFVSLPNRLTATEGGILVGKVRHIASDYVLVAGIEGGLTEFSVGGARMVRERGDGTKETIGMNDLTNEEVVSVSVAGDQTKKRVTAFSLYAKPFHMSFAGQVKEAGNPIVIKSRTVWGTDIRLLENPSFRVVRYNESDGLFTSASVSDLKKGDRVVVEGLEVPEKSDVFLTGTVIIVNALHAAGAEP